MFWPFQSNERWLIVRLCTLILVVWAVGTGATVHAQGIESIMAPGKLIQGHAKYEDDCSQCHVKLDRKAQDKLCMNCHKEIGSDVRQQAGYHGRLDHPVCKSCHTEHKGRNHKIVELNVKKFDHTKTDFY